MIQGGDEWRQAKLGKLGASKVHEALAKTKTGGWGAGRETVLSCLVLERLTGAPQDSYTSAAMLWGIETEPLARAAYEFHADVDVDLAGFLDHTSIAMSGCSPDGLIGKVGMVEFKCPERPTHLRTLLGASIDGRYIKQMQWQMSTTGRAWCDFASFDPRFPPEMQLHVRRVNRDDKLIAELEREVSIFLEEVAETEAKLRRLYMTGESFFAQDLKKSVEMERAGA